jgi:hypothetical protein
MCDKQRSVWSISVPGANNRLSYPASMTSLWHVIKRDIQGSIHKSILQRRRISIQNVKLIGVRQWENSVIPKILESRRWTCSWQDFFLRARNPSRFTNMIHWNLSKLPSVDIIVMAMLIFTPSCWLLRTMKIEQLLQFPSKVTPSCQRLSIITLFSEPLSVWFPLCPIPE